jgi:hypothetical protein
MSSAYQNHYVSGERDFITDQQAYLLKPMAFGAPANNAWRLNHSQTIIMPGQLLPLGDQ